MKQPDLMDYESTQDGIDKFHKDYDEYLEWRKNNVNLLDASKVYGIKTDNSAVIAQLEADKARLVDSLESAFFHDDLNTPSGLP